MKPDGSIGRHGRSDGSGAAQVMEIALAHEQLRVTSRRLPRRRERGKNEEEEVTRAWFSIR